MIWPPCTTDVFLITERARCIHWARERIRKRGHWRFHFASASSGLLSREAGLSHQGQKLQKTIQKEQLEIHWYDTMTIHLNCVFSALIYFYAFSPNLQSHLKVSLVFAVKYEYAVWFSGPLLLKFRFNISKTSMSAMLHWWFWQSWKQIPQILQSLTTLVVRQTESTLQTVAWILQTDYQKTG